MKETIAIAIGPVVIALMAIIAWCLPKLQMGKLDHEYRMAQHRESISANDHKRYLELEAAGKPQSELELQARIAEAQASKESASAQKIRAETEAEKERNRRRTY